MVRNPVERWFCILAGCVLLGGCGPQPPAASAVAAARITVGPDAQTARFLQQHWARPLAPQGPPPGSAAATGISLSAQSCATCHAGQFEDWRHSLHSRAMDAGVLGQLVDMPAHARDDHQGCLRCHAPLAEQADSLVSTLEKLQTSGPRAAEGMHDTAPLHEQGLVCAACHVRQGAWYGPPRRDGSGPAADPRASPHGGWKAEQAFESSHFCAACHQFDSEGYALNGKLLENTVNEWQDSRHAREGTSCQSCHMPDRRHLWRGIHDPEMVRRAVRIEVDAADLIDGRLVSRMTVTNSGVGHFFPTYVTPQVVIRAFQQDAGGRKLAGTDRAFVIARQVTQDLGREIADTRIPPDGQAVFDYRVPRQRGAKELIWQVQVQPDAFYLELYEGLLRSPQVGNGRQLIRQARDNAAASPYQLYSTRLPLP